MAEVDDDEAEELPPDTYDASDPKQVRRRQRKSKFEADQKADFWRQALSHPIGRRVIWELLADCHTFEVPIEYSQLGTSVPEASWFRSGRQSIGMRLYHLLLVIDQPAVHQMHCEHDARFAKPNRRT